MVYDALTEPILTVSLFAINYQIFLKTMNLCRKDSKYFFTNVNAVLSPQSALLSFVLLFAICWMYEFWKWTC